MNRIDVAVGIIRDQAGKFLVGQRTVQDRYYRKWEFPGGKLESGESVEQALRRELHEELGIIVQRSNAMATLSHDYPDRSVLLHVQRVIEFDGVPAGIEGQALRWVDRDTLAEIDFLAGNQPIIDLL